MAVKIRLARHGKKGYPFYHIIAADSRAPRNGRFIEKIGTYNPNTNPATVELDSDRALYWLNVGAQPTDTCRTILSCRGVMLKKHLAEGVKKGAITEEVAAQRFDAWMAENVAKIERKKDALSQAGHLDKKARFEAEQKVKDAKSAELKKKADDAAAALAAANAPKEVQAVADAPSEDVAEENA